MREDIPAPLPVGCWSGRWLPVDQPWRL